ncbi:MAG: hypothetical protein O6931_07550 [Gammaproteobacteria bacterium]|nr:hypothetical protein [Gammaproteobacteria bacterium]
MTDQKTENLNQALPVDPRELEKVFAEFGATIHAAQCLEYALGLLMALLTKYEDAKFEGRPDKSLSAALSSQTLGELFRSVRKQEFFTSAERKKVHKAIKQRNQLVHSYLVDKAEFFLGARSRAKLVEDLQKRRSNLREANAIIDGMLDRYLQEHGTSIEELHDFWEPLVRSDEELPDDFID